MKMQHPAKYIALNKLFNQSKFAIDHPATIQSRVLLPGENVVGQFECYKDVNSLSLSSHIKLFVFTFGLYSIYLIWRLIMNIMYVLKIYDKGYHHLERCVMQITNQGRLIMIKVNDVYIYMEH